MNKKTEILNGGNSKYEEEIGAGSNAYEQDACVQCE